MKIITTFLLLTSLTLAACDSNKSPSQNEFVQREGQPSYVQVSEEDPEMNRAILDAQKSLDKFITVIKAPTASQNRFAIKKSFKDGKKVEFMWLASPSFDGKKFSGRLDNEPVNVKTVKKGQIVTATKDEIADWFYIDKGKLIGGYSVRLLHSRMTAAEQKEFEANLDYKF
jgi:uncharacterized protein YegJ (DUF2314 family)